MPKLGSLSYPSVKLTRAIEVTRRISTELKGNVSVSGLATVLEMAERGGGFMQLAAALRDYGLVEGRGDLSVTGTAERILFAESPDDAARARAEAFFTVELFRRMREKLAADIPSDSRLRAILQEISKESLTAIHQKAALIKSIWTDGIQSFGSQVPDAPDHRLREGQGDTDEDNLTGDSDSEFIVVKPGASVIKVRRDPEEIDLVIRLLQVLRDSVSAETPTNGVKALPASGQE